tara:strand:+ start:7464 stop:8258 length:795 start_codon:yes stop_codon:yes gene_type:complete
MKSSPPPKTAEANLERDQKKAVSYLRVSGIDQVDGDGFPRQRDSVAAFAKKNGLKVDREFRDEGVSGTLGFADRPALADLVAWTESSDIGVVLVEKADRVARDLIQSELILTKLRELGVTVIEAATGNRLTDNDDPTSTLIRQILGAFYEFEKSNLVARLRAARERKKAETGRCGGRLPYGEKQGEEEALTCLRRLRRKSPKTGKPMMTWEMVADEMNRLGHPTRRGMPWTDYIARDIFHATTDRLAKAQRDRETAARKAKALV